METSTVVPGGDLADRIAALEEKVAALESPSPSPSPSPFMPIHDPDGDIGMAFNSIAARLNRQQPAIEVEYQKAVLELCGRTRELAQKVAALEQDDAGAYAGQLRRLLLSANEENHRLRAENAEMKTKMLRLNGFLDAECTRLTRDCNAACDARDAALKENAELRKRVESIGAAAAALDSALRDAERSWPAPQPIETAPLGDILAGPAPNGFAWAPERPLAGCSLESWRTQLREAERRWWVPMPPPPGGGK